MSHFEPGPKDFDSPFYDPEDDSPITKLYRHEYEAELGRLKVINKLLDSLSPADAQAELFTQRERWWFDIKPHKKRPRGE